MNFQDLKYHLEKYGCTFDHMEDNVYWVMNSINLHVCQIEELKEYSKITLCHYFFELGVPPPHEYADFYDEYRNFRNDVVKIPLK